MPAQSRVDPGAPPGIRIPAAVLAEIEGWAWEGYPSEVCGLLIGRPAGAGEELPHRTEVRRAARARNRRVERAGDRYDLDPADHLAAEDAARREGLSVVGVWHTHPDHPARPSEVDRRGAWEGWSYLILSVGPEGVRETRSWRLDGADFVEEELTAP